MSSKTEIANQAMVRIGEALFTDVDTAGTTPADEINAIWDEVLADVMDMGPEKGWRFGRRTFHGIDRDSIAITALAELVADTTTTVTGTHTLIAGDMVQLVDTNIDGTYDVNSISTTVSFAIDAVFVATDTGTAYWTSEEFAYRFSRPTCTRVTTVRVGGIELTDWARTGDWILTNQESDEVDMDYILAAAIVTVANIPSHVIQVLWRKLAIHVLYARVQNQSLQNRLTEEIIEVYLPRAIGIDAKEQYVQEQSNAWTAAGHTTTVIE